MESNEERVLSVIKAIRQSFTASIVVYTMGGCYQFYNILKAIFPEAEGYNAGHILTKIGDKYYDITGEIDVTHLKLVPIDQTMLGHNGYSDEMRAELRRKGREELYANVTKREELPFKIVNNKVIIPETEIKRILE